MHLKHKKPALANTKKLSLGLLHPLGPPARKWSEPYILTIIDPTRGRGLLDITL